MGLLQPEEWAEVQRLFARAADLPPEKRPEFLELECSSPELRHEVVSLLRHCDVDPPAAAEAAAWIAESLSGGGDPDEHLIGARLGPYRVESIVGRGGMGAVYRAARDDAEFSQLVALKLVRAAAASPTALLRFRRERQILARLSHPNIARLLDGGSTPEGIPYLVMEFIEGEPITDWCDQRALGIEARLRVFLRVCQAVAFAHRESVVHRDLKPANILVAKDGEPKLLDFGIAKILEPGSGHDNLTRTGIPVMTPEYAAPEQVMGEPISAAADVYVLGLVLYELLTGKKAQEIPVFTPAAIARIVCHLEPPPAVTLNPALAGDIDNVIRMALRKEPHRRYPTAAGLASDIQKHLEARPVAARADSLAYRAAKFFRRNRLVLLAGTLVVLLSAGLAVSFAVARQAIPRALQLTQLTQTGHANYLGGVVCDGSQVYFTERGGDAWQLARVSVHGGLPQRLTVSPPLPFPDIQDISPDGSQLLVATGVPVEDTRQLWVLPVTGGTPRRLGNTMARSAAWSRDGGSIVISRDSTLFRIDADATHLRKLLTAPGKILGLRCAPMPLPEILRFCVWNPNTGSIAIWQAAADGTGLHRMLHDSTPVTAVSQDSSAWLFSGKYYLFRSWRQRVASIWVMRERHNFLQAGGPPSQIYSSPLEFAALAPAPDGRRVFFAGGQEHRELMQCGTGRRCSSFSEAIAGRSVNFAKDGRAMAYMSFPQAALWRCRPDGTLRTQLTPSWLAVGQPQWSPDGKWIAFVGSTLGASGHSPSGLDSPGILYIIPSDGGQPQAITASDWEASWSASGDRLLFGRSARPGDSSRPGLYVVDLKTRATNRLPDSDTVLRAAWSPDGRYAAGTNQAGSQILLFDFQTRRWITGPKGAGLGYPYWSHDSKYVYYQDVFGDPGEPIFRMRISSGKIELVMTLNRIPQSNVDHYTLAGLAADDTPVVSVRHTDSDVYALDLELP